MANRLNNPNQFETLPPPWLLTSLDTNATQNQAAWNDSSLGFVNGICIDTGSANNYAITSGNLPFGAPSAYNPGMTVFLIPANTNTGTSVITVGLLGSVAILNSSGGALSGGELQAGVFYGLVYNNVAPVGFRIIGSGQSVVNSYLGTISANQTIPCAGAVIISVQANVSTGFNPTITLNNVNPGAVIKMWLESEAGGSVAYTIIVNNPASTAYNWRVKNSTSGNIALGTGSFVFTVSSTKAIDMDVVAYAGAGTPVIQGAFSQP